MFTSKLQDFHCKSQSVSHFTLELLISYDDRMQTNHN